MKHHLDIYQQILIISKRRLKKMINEPSIAIGINEVNTRFDVTVLFDCR